MRYIFLKSVRILGVKGVLNIIVFAICQQKIRFWFICTQHVVRGANSIFTTNSNIRNWRISSNCDVAVQEVIILTLSTNNITNGSNKGKRL
jgi:hypothetical protein